MRSRIPCFSFALLILTCNFKAEAASPTNTKLSASSDVNFKPAPINGVASVEQKRSRSIIDEAKIAQRQIEFDEAKAANALIAGLASRQALDPQDYLHFQSPTGDAPSPNRTQLRTLRVKDEAYIVAIQSFSCSWSEGIIGCQIILMEQNGKILDRIQCSIRNGFDSGDLSVQIYPDPEPEGAQLVISYIGSPARIFDGSEIPAWFHEDHRITYHGRTYTYSVDDRIVRTGKPVEPDAWAKKGLCRAKIENGKFTILFPQIEAPDEQLRAAKSLQVTYQVNGAWTSATLDDKKVIDELVSTIRATRLSQMTSGPLPPGALSSAISKINARVSIDENSVFKTCDIHFRLSGSDEMTAYFLSPATIFLKGWGCLDLKTSDFHDRLCKILSKREGQDIKLIK